MRTTFMLIQKYESARQVVDRLMEKNIDKEEINVIAQKSAVESAWDVNQRTIDVDVTKAVGQKEVKGLDALLGRQRPVATSSAGELLAAGTIAEVIAKTAGAPGASGNLKNALVEFGVENQAAERFSEGIRSGEMLVFIRTDDENSAMVREVLQNTGISKNTTFTV